MRRFQRALLLATLLPATLLAATGIAAAGQPDFSAQERRKILSLGPWPPPFAPDPSNRASGNATAIALGARLFFDARLSPSGDVACASCHQPDRNCQSQHYCLGSHSSIRFPL